MSAIGKAIKLFAIGGSLITTNTIWLFDYSGNNANGDKKDDDPNINSFDPIAPLTSRSQKVLKDSNFKRIDITPNLGLNFTYNTTTKKNLRIGPWANIGDFRMTSNYYATTRKQYKSFDRSTMQIQLFDKPVWHNDEQNPSHIYKEPLSQDQVNALFKDRDEVLVKQLLHGLHQRREWQYFYTSDSTIFYQTTLVWPGQLKDLTNLKIQYFSDFDDFKDYVHKKVDSCSKDLKKACVADTSELDIMETNQESFFSQNN